MSIAILSIGTEILRGTTTNSNLAFIGETLMAQGYTVAEEMCIPDTVEAIRRGLGCSFEAADTVITIGGLGPTKDDITKKTAAAFLGLELRHDQGTHERVAAYLKRRHAKLPEASASIQAEVPEGATVLPNDNGTAPGLWCPSGEGNVLIMLPGPPRELKPLFSQKVLPLLKERERPTFAVSRVRVCGIPESLVEEKTEAAIASFPQITAAYCAKPAGVDVRLECDRQQASVLEKATVRLRDCFAGAVLPEGFSTPVAHAADLLERRGWRLGVAESCTGGMIASRITSFPGASRFFTGGFITYSNAMKERYCGVKPATLERYGAVSEETAREMAAGTRTALGVETSIAVTGIAGPSGGTAEKPVGLVFIATSVNGTIEVKRETFPGNRDTVRQRTVAHALNQLRIGIAESDM